jgi:hypothetical protein
MERVAQALPPLNGRLAGFVYLLYFLTTFAAELFMEQAGAGVRVVSSDAAATATSIVSHEAAYRFGLVWLLVSIACYIGVVALFYRLFVPVSRSIALLALCAGLVRLTIWACATLCLLVPLVVLSPSFAYLSVFSVQQLQAIALLSLGLHNQAYTVGFVFEGLFWISIGYLMFRSTFVPRTVGALFAVAGVTYEAFLWRPFADELLLYIGVFSMIAEITMMLWLLVKGVNIQRWTARWGE